MLVKYPVRTRNTCQEVQQIIRRMEKKCKKFNTISYEDDTIDLNKLTLHLGINAQMLIQKVIFVELVYFQTKKRIGWTD